VNPLGEPVRHTRSKDAGPCEDDRRTLVCPDDLNDDLGTDKLAEHFDHLLEVHSQNLLGPADKSDDHRRHQLRGASRVDEPQVFSFLR
jgi:hypothetical protein